MDGEQQFDTLRRLCINLTFLNEFISNLAFPNTTEPMQDKDMTLPKVCSKKGMHMRYDILPASEDVSWWWAHL